MHVKDCSEYSQVTALAESAPEFDIFYLCSNDIYALAKLTAPDETGEKAQYIPPLRWNKPPPIPPTESSVIAGAGTGKATFVQSDPAQLPGFLYPFLLQ